MLLLKYFYYGLSGPFYLNITKSIRDFNLIIIFLLISSTSVYATDTIVLNQSGGPPLNDFKLTGFMDRIAQEAFSRLNVKLEIVQLPAERSLINSNKGIIDGEMGRIAGLNNKYKNLVQVNEKIMDWEFVVYSNKKINLNNGWNSLIPYTVAIINGWKILEKNVPKEVELTKVKYPAQLFGMLKLHRSDLIIYEKWSGKYYLKKNKITDVKLIPRTLITKELFIYLNKKHNKLAVKLARSLKSMKDDGTYKKIESETLKKLE